MIHLAILLIFNALICAGLYTAMQFEFMYSSFDKKKTPDDIDSKTKGVLWWWKFAVLDANWMPYWLSKPLGNCLTCMASVYSFVPFWWYVKWNMDIASNWALYPFYILALAGLNRIFDKYLNEV